MVYHVLNRGNRRMRISGFIGWWGSLKLDPLLDLRLQERLAAGFGFGHEELHPLGEVAQVSNEIPNPNGTDIFVSRYDELI